MGTLIKNGYIVDGTGNPGFYGDIEIVEDTITRIGVDLTGRFTNIIDAKGLVASPGFIDTHSHSDLVTLVDPIIKPKIHQGITTEVLGQDGISMAPLPRKYIESWRKNLSGLDGDSDEIYWNYEDTEGYFKLLTEKGLGLNLCYLVPHGNIRMEAMGLENRKATQKEIENMKEITRREMEAGAVGLSTGLIYIPCAYGDSKELIELCKVVSEYDGVFVVHQRSEANDIIASMKEIINISRETGVRVHFSHFKVCGKNNWGKLDAVINILEGAKNDGIDISFDQYPYVAGSTMLSAILPPWVHSGGVNAMLQRLRDKGIRQRIIKEVMDSGSNWDNFVEFAGYDGIFITSVKTSYNKNVVGKSLIELGKIRDIHPLDAAFDLLIEEDNAVGMIDYYGKEEHIIRLLKLSEQNICTDGLLGGKPHPRVYGAFPRVLGKYVREEKILSLEEAVYKMTYKSAKVFRLNDRGIIKEGKKADIVIFDQEKIIDKGTFVEPMQYPEGIHKVIINGELVFDEGIFNNNLSGHLLLSRTKKLRR